MLIHLGRRYPHRSSIEWQLLGEREGRKEIRISNEREAKARVGRTAMCDGWGAVGGEGRASGKGRGGRSGSEARRFAQRI